MKNLLFEIHITTEDLSEKEVEKFEGFCQTIEAKPIVIELSKGVHFQQPMISKVFRCTEGNEIHAKIDQLTKQFTTANYPVSRVKIEVPLEIEEQAKGIFAAHEKTYFEWHGKLEIQDLQQVKNLCAQHDAHLSKNSLKKNPKSKFITIRDFQSADSIRKRVADLKKDMNGKGWHFEKEEFEYCIFDSNESLDKGWIG